MNNMVALYWLITAANTKQKKKDLQEPLDMSQPINLLLKIINDGVWYTSEANTPFSPVQVLQMARHSVRSSVIYIDTCE